MKKMLVNVVNLNRDGIQIIWLIKMRRWEELGYEISIHAGFFIKRISLLGKDVYDFNNELQELRNISEEQLSKFGYIWYALKRNFRAFFLYNEVKNEGYDVIYTLTSVLEFTLFPVVYCFFNRRVKWITVFDNTVPLQGPGNKFIRFLAWIFFHISLVLLRRADIIYTITPDLEKYLLKRGFNRKRVILTGCAVEVERIKQAVFDKEHAFDALFMGRINEKKGIYDMLDILELVRKEMPAFKLGIMGGGDTTTVLAYQKEIQKRNLKDNIRFLGYRRGAEKFNIIKSSKVFWFFSYDESFGVALLEAVCSGKPAFVYDLPPYRYLYPNQEVTIFKNQDYRAIANQTIGLIKGNILENSKGRMLLERFDWAKIVELEYRALER